MRESVDEPEHSAVYVLHAQECNLNTKRARCLHALHFKIDWALMSLC